MKRIFLGFVTSVAVALLLCSPTLTLAQIAPSLGTAESFAILAGSAVTNTGFSIITGSLGLSPGSAVSGFPPGTVSQGAIYIGDAVAISAKNSLVTAYNALAVQACDADLTGTDLGGLTLTSGVYCFDSSAQLTGNLVLDAEFNDDAVFIFKMGSTLTTASNSTVSMINGGTVCNVFWQVGSSATLGTTTQFMGTIIALTSITLNTDANITGRALARNGAVTLDSNNVDASPCLAGCPDPYLLPEVLPNAMQGTPYSQLITGHGGTAPYIFTIASGTPPAGITLSPGGMLSGTPTSRGTSTFTVRGTDSLGCFATIPYTLIVLSPLPTLPQWGAIFLATGLLGLGYLRLRRRRDPAGC